MNQIFNRGHPTISDAGIPYETVQHASVGYVYGDSCCGQRAIYEIGLTGIPVYNVNNNCSTGSTALMQAVQLVQGKGLTTCGLCCFRKRLKLREKKA